jgi:uncharacterized membrane protein
MMTKIEFITFLESSLDFLDSDEKDGVLNFFLEKFSFCSTKEEEQAIIDAFGTSEQLISKLKEEKNSDEKKHLNANKCLESILRNHLKSGENNEEDGDLIFSKKIMIEKSSEVVHSMEDHEVKPIYGEKVVIQNRDEAEIDEVTVEPIDEANGLTNEEILMAKAKTLKKAENFETEEDSKEAKKESEERIPLEEDDHEVCKNAKQNAEVAKKDFFGVINKIFPSEKYNKTTKIALIALLTLAISPILAFVFGICLFAYAGLVAFTFATVLLLFLLMILIVAIGVVELVHGFLVIFDSIEAALIELGFGTVLFSFVIAIGALIYEFIFGIVPKWVKWLTKIFIRYTRLLYCYLYGGKA